MFAFDSNLKPIVGQQVTLTSANATVANPRINLLIARAAAGDADLIVKYNLAGKQRGAHRLSSGTFETDKSSEAVLTDNQLRNIAQTAGQEVTYTAVPPGSGYRIGVDRDMDTIFDGDDNCPAFSNAGQEDNENDGAGDVCDPDDDNDGLSDAQENILGTNSLLADTDGDGYNDYFENITGNDPLDEQSFPIYGDINGDGLVGTADLIKATQFVFNLSTPMEAEMLRGNVAPLVAGIPAPDNLFNTADLLLIQRKIFGLVSF